MIWYWRFTSRSFHVALIGIVVAAKGVSEVQPELQPGKEATQIWEGEKKFGVAVRLGEEVALFAL